ncbi:MAG: hypothetical protein MHPSP_003770 [Paramarteilia canceri]
MSDANESVLSPETVIKVFGIKRKISDFVNRTQANKSAIQQRTESNISSKIKDKYGWKQISLNNLKKNKTKLEIPVTNDEGKFMQKIFVELKFNSNFVKCD